jgi:Tol biopolymer transport system component
MRSEERALKRLLKVMAVGLTFLSFLYLGAPTAGATVTGENGRIAFRRFFNEEQTRAAIFTIKPNGTEERQITRPPRGVLHQFPDWSPSGRILTYIRSSDGHGGRIFRIRKNGTGRKPLSTTCTDPEESDNCLGDDDPAWAPNGKRIAFARYSGTDLEHLETVELMVMRAVGSRVRNVTDHEGPRYFDWAPQWSPDGDQLVFHREDKQDRTAIFTVRVDGTRERRITPWNVRGEGEPDWSPNGRWILFESRADVCLVHPNGNGRHCITRRYDLEWGSASFSPDGRRIVAPAAPGVGQPGYFDVFVMRLDGTGLTNVTQTRAWEGTPDWGSRPR